MTNPFDGNLANVFLALDPTLFENKQDVALVPVSGGRHPASPVLAPGAAGTHSGQRVGSPHVRVEDGRFRMWYVAGDGRFLRYGGGPLSLYQDSYEGMWLCYAESDDGIHWTQPALGLCEFNGSKRNNIIGKGACPSFLFDPADPDPKRRYKCVFDWWDADTPSSMYTGSSLDGIHWTYDFAHSPHESMECPNLYRWGDRIHALTQVFDPLVRTPDPGGLARRVNALFVTEDFGHWARVPGIAFQLPRQDPMRPGFDVQCHMGPTVYHVDRFGMGIFGRFIAPSSDQRETRTSLGLCLSDDGRHFFEPFWRFDLLPLPDNDAAWDAHMLVQPAGASLVETGDEWWMYYKGSRGGNVWSGAGPPSIGIARWRKHGFAYLTTLHESCVARFSTGAIDVPGTAEMLTVNASVPQGCEIRIDIRGDAATYRGAAATGDGVALSVHWDTPVDWRRLRGAPVGLRFGMTGAPHAVRLYSFAMA